MKLNFRMIGKIGFIVVLIGFLCPIACDYNGFQIANSLIDNNSAMSGLLFYLMALSAVAGAVIGVLLLMKKNVKPIVDWIVVIVCIASGLIVYFTQIRSNSIDLQYGAYIILVGWIIALCAQVISHIKKE